MHGSEVGPAVSGTAKVFGEGGEAFDAGKSFWADADFGFEDALEGAAIHAEASGDGFDRKSAGGVADMGAGDAGPV